MIFMSNIPDLHYIDKAQMIVRAVPYSRDRAQSITQMFFNSRKDALTALKPVIEARVQDGVDKLMAIERELAAGK